MADKDPAEKLVKDQEKVEKAEDRAPRGDDPAPQSAPAGPAEVVRGPDEPRTLSPSPHGERNTLNPVNSRDPDVRAAALAQVNSEVARAQVESSNKKVSVDLTAAEVAALLNAANGGGPLGTVSDEVGRSAKNKLNEALNKEAEKASK